MSLLSFLASPGCLSSPAIPASSTRAKPQMYARLDMIWGCTTSWRGAYSGPATAFVSLRSCTVATIAHIHGGDIAAICKIEFEGSKPSLVLKVYPDSLHWKMRKEVAVSTLIQDRLSVPTPRVLFADDSKKLLSLNFILMTELEGSNLCRIEPTLTPDQLVSAYVQIGQLLREFHRIPMEAFGYIGPNGIWTAHATNYAYISCQFDRKLQEFADRGGAISLARRVEVHAADRMGLLHECTQPVLCHNDLHAGGAGSRAALRRLGF